MIDWLSVALNSIWILGLATILATLSYHNWRAAESGHSLRQHLQYPTFLISFTIGACLFCLGVAGLGRAWWERLVWVALALLCGLQGWQAWRANQDQKEYHLKK